MKNKTRGPIDWDDQKFCKVAIYDIVAVIVGFGVADAVVILDVSAVVGILQFWETKILFLLALDKWLKCVTSAWVL